MKHTLSLFLVFIAVSLAAQPVQWAFKVLDHSSQKTTKEYAAKQILGMPNAFPAGTDHINAWESKAKGGEEYIKVGFLTPMQPKQIIIVESFQPGHITHLFVYDADGKEYEIINYTMRPTQASSRILHVNTSNLRFSILSLKVVLHCEKDKPTGIDAIGISVSDKLYKNKPSSRELIKSSMIATRLDTTVNSVYPEMGPLVSPDGKTLYFSRSDDPSNIGGKRDQEDIWYAEWNETKKAWGAAKNMGSPLNNEEPNFINSISPDGNTILLGNSYMEDGSMEDGVSSSTRTTEGWSDPNRLMIEDDSRNVSKMANYFMSNSQKILLISNDRKGDSFGDRDLYVSFLKADTTWTKPLNLGQGVNTKATEAAPFLASDDKTLYFTSDGLNGYGGSDIYMTRRIDDTWTNWSIPENLGPVVNTSHDESFLTLNAAGDRVYFTSQSSDQVDVDMYEIKLPAILKPLPVMLLSGRVINSVTKEEISSTRIVFENLATGITSGMATSNPMDGAYRMVLPAGSNYGYLAEKEGFVSVHDHVDLRGMKSFQELNKDLYLTPLETGQVIVIHNVFFDFDKYILKKESFQELNRIAVLLQKNKTMTIELAANTDNVGTQMYNDKLSSQRAKAVHDYLVVQSGVSQERIIMKYYGESNPVTSNSTKKGRQLNRRVEFKILTK